MAISMSIGMVGLRPNMTSKGDDWVDSCTDVLYTASTHPALPVCLLRTSTACFAWFDCSVHQDH